MSLITGGLGASDNEEAIIFDMSIEDISFDSSAIVTDFETNLEVVDFTIEYTEGD